MYNFYKYGGGHGYLPNEYQVVFRKISPRWNTLHNVLWHVFSWFGGSRFYEYQIVKDDIIVSTAQVCPKLPIFAFFNRGGYHIGPCMTIKEERGKGFYPILLQYIIEEHPERDYYMIIDENNIPSQKGVAKVNFQPFAVGHKDRLGRYVIDRFL